MSLSTDGCRKTKYLSMEMALSALVQVQAKAREHPSRAARFGAYYCIRCGRYHIGHLTVHRYKKVKGRP